jgi:hypothetical protein
LTASDITLKWTDAGGTSESIDLGLLFGDPMTHLFKANADLTRMGISAADDETIKSVEITDSSGFKEVKQIEFSLTPVPVPPAIALFGSGLLGLSFLSRRRRNGQVTP